MVGRGGARAGKHALTRYAVLEGFAGAASLLRCRLATGRTHQIRVHMSAINHPCCLQTITMALIYTVKKKVHKLNVFPGNFHYWVHFVLFFFILF